MKYKLTALLTMATLTLTSHANENVSPNSLEGNQGQKLYNLPSNCITCHQANGQGLAGAIPPLAKSLWVTGDLDRLIKISLKGLEGEILVNQKKFSGSMPPQTNTRDEDLAKILTYIRQAWGNQASAVTLEDIQRVKKEMEGKDYHLDSLLSNHPFDLKQKNNNGKYIPQDTGNFFDDSQPVVLRTFMPDASPASFAVSIPGGHYYCWDAGACRLAYAWSLGGFIRNNKTHWEGNGKRLADFNGLPYYRAVTKGYDGKKNNTIDLSNSREPLYSFVDNENFPFRIGDKSAHFKVKFKGYRLVAGLPQFIYDFGPVRIHESISLNKATNRLEQHFEIDSKETVRLSLSSAEKLPALLKSQPAYCQISASAGIIKDGVLTLSAEEASSFSVYYQEIKENISDKKVWHDADRALAEHPSFKYQGNYKTQYRQKKGEAEVTNFFYQVAVIGDDQFLVAKYENNFPGYQHQSIDTPPESRMVSLQELQKILEPLRKENPRNRQMGAIAPEGADVIFGEPGKLLKSGELYHGLVYPPIETLKKYQAFTMHLEFRLPYKPYVMPGHQDRGDSGLFLKKDLEVQILDSFALDYDESRLPFKPQSSSMQWCGSFYKKHLAAINATRPPLEWQSLDVDCDGDKISVNLNGVSIHSDVSITESMEVIRLQNHGDAVAYRNFWIIEK